MSIVAMQTREEVETVSQQQSLAVVKNMIRTSISEICYLRNLFDGDCFSKKNYAGIVINALHPVDNNDDNNTPHIRNQEAWQLTRWLEEGVFEALEKRYLRGLVFAIYDNPCDKPKSRLLETYSYAFTYPDTTNITLEYTQSNGESSILSTDGVKNQAVILLRTLITMCDTLNPLPKERWITIQLYYYDDITPPDYQPKFFEDTAEASIRPGDSSFVSDPFVIQAGKLRTPFHAMCMKVRVTEGALHESCVDVQSSGENVIQVNAEAETKMEMEEEPDSEVMDDEMSSVLERIIELGGVDIDSLMSSCHLKKPELETVLMKLNMQGYLNKIRNGYIMTNRTKQWNNPHVTAESVLLGSVHCDNRSTRPAVKSISFSQGNTNVVDVLVEPERSVSSSQQSHRDVSPSPRTVDAAAKALKVRQTTWGTPITEPSSSQNGQKLHAVTGTRRMEAITKRKRIVRAPKKKEESDDEFTLTDVKSDDGDRCKRQKRSNVKRPIDQGMNDLSRVKRIK